MNLPNKLTMLRLIMVPFYFAFLKNTQPWSQSVALVLFIAASLTDLIDGHIARSRNMITDFGKFVDPIADKVLVTTGMLVMLAQGRMADWVVILFIAREFIVAAFRQLAAKKGVVIAADKLGKYKTLMQTIALCMLTGFKPVAGQVLINSAFFLVLSEICLYIALALSVASCVDYILKNRSVLSGEM